MKRKLILMAIIAFSGFSIEANAAVNDEALSNVQNKVIEYINNYSFTNNADESATEGTTNNINVLHSPGEVVFTSSNPEVATVDGNGNVVAIAPGKAYITVSTADSCRTRKAVIRVLGENELPDVDLPDTDNDINIDTDINIDNDNNINIDISINKPSGNWPSINWPTGGTIGGTTGGTIGSLGSANKISTTPTTLSSAKGTSISTLPNTGVAIPLEAIGAISLLGGLGIYKKRK